jgi:hypothetical protein
MNTTISDAAVEAACAVVYSSYVGGSWSYRVAVENEMREALEAALPHLAADAVPVAWLIHWSKIPLEAPEVTTSASRVDAVSALTGPPRIEPLYTHPQPAAMNEVSGNSGELGGEYAGETLNKLRILLDHMCDSSTFQPPNDYNLGFDAGWRMATEQAALTATGKQQGGEVQGDVLTRLPTYRLADDTQGRRGIYLDATGSWVKIQDVERALAARQPVGQEPGEDECRCENGGVRYDARGCTCLKCGKRPAWYMGGRRVRITERRRTNYHPDPDTFEAVCTWHMGEDLEYRKDGEASTRRVNNYRQNLGSVEVIR